MATTIEQLELEVQSNTASAVSGLEALSETLGKVKTATKGGMGLTSVSKRLESLNTALSALNTGNFDKISKVAESLEKLKSVSGVKISPSIANQLSKISAAADTLNNTNFGGIQTMKNALAPLNNVTASEGLKNTISQLKSAAKLPGILSGADWTGMRGQIEQMVNALAPLKTLEVGTGLGTAVSQLRSVTKISDTLDKVDWSKFTAQIQQLSNALAPLATQLNTIGNAFSQLPSEIKQVVAATNQLTSANSGATRSYTSLWAKASVFGSVMKRGASMIASWIQQSNQYVEDINLFDASMGKYAESAQNYAEKVGEVLGIDPGEFMRNQGTFNTIITGFGVVSDKAYMMSQNLTQLSYDLASFFNISFDSAMKKVQSGISGELEPMRALGYDLSVARLQEEALALGIKKKVSAMTQAEKSQLRYYAMLTQVTTAQGDMARTLNAPANQIRVLKAQLTQCARALGNIFIPALNAVLPYVIAVTKAVRKLAEGIANLVGFELPEVDYSGLSSITGVADDMDESMEDATATAKKLKRTIMGFDELNVLQKADDSSKTSTGSGLGSNDLGIDLPSYDFLGDAVDNRVDSIIAQIKSCLQEITAIVSGFALAIGTILVVTGANIPVGLGLMAAGAVGLAATIAANWSGMSQRLASVLTVVTGVLGGFLLAVGAFLALTGGNVPLGIGLMAAGAVSLGTAATINWKFLNGNLTNALSVLTGIVGGALLGIGAMLAFSGADVPLGIGLMAVGAVNMAAAVGLNWNAMSEPLRKAIGVLEAVIGGAMLVFGAIAAFTGVDIPLGVAMMVIGATSLTSAVALNWNALTGDVKNALATLTAIVSGALLGIGAMLAFSGADVPLGIGLMAVGAVNMAAAVGLNWNAMSEPLRKAIGVLEAVIGGAMLVFGAIAAFTGVDIPLGVAMMVIGATSLTSAVALNWNALTGDVKNALATLTAIVSGALIGVGAILALSTPTSTALGIAMIAAGAVGIVSTASLNWGGMTEKIKSVLKEIGIAVGGSLLAVGAILALSNPAAMPIGIGMMVAGAASLAAGVALNWGTIGEKVKSCLVTITKMFVGASLAALGVMLLGTGIGTPLGLGLIAAGLVGLVKPESFNVQNLVKLGSDAVNGITTGVQTAWSNLQTVCSNLFQSLKDNVTSAMDTVKTAVVEKWNAVTDFMSTVPEKVGNAVNAVGAWFGGLPDKIAYSLGFALGHTLKWAADTKTAMEENVSQAVTSAVQWFTGLPERISGGLESARTSIAAWGTNVYGSVTEAASQSVTSAQTWFTSLPERISSSISGTYEKVATWGAETKARFNEAAAGIITETIMKFSDFAQKFYDSISKTGEAIAKWGTDMVKKAKKAAGDVVNAVVKGIKELPDKLKKLGQDIVDGFVKGITDAWKTITDAVSNFVDSFVNGFKNGLGIHSPSTVFQSIGLNVVAGLQNGLRNIGSVFTSAFSTIGSWVSGFGKNMYTWGSDLMGNMVSGISSGLRTLKDKVSEAASTIRSYLHFSQPDVGPLADFNTWMPDMMSQLAGGIAKDTDKVRKQVENLAGVMSLEPTVQANVNAAGGTPAVRTNSGDNTAELANAVYNAVSAALHEQNSSEDSGTPIVINLGNEQIASFMVKQNRRAALISGGRA